MGLLKAVLSAGGTTLADQWRDFFTVDAMDENTLIKRGQKKEGGSNTKGSEGVITKGSVISVPVGTVMVVTDNGKIAEFTAEAGEFTYDSSSESTCLYGNFGEGLMESFKTFGKRFTFGGEAAKDQRVYYINIKEMMGNKFGTATPMSYQDPTYKNIYIRYFGQYSFKISDPIKFFSNISGNVQNIYTKELLMDQCNAEFLNALDTSLNNCSDEGIVFSRLPSQQLKLAKYMNDSLDEEWVQRRGMEIVSVAIEKVTPDDKSRERIEKFDTSELMSDEKRAVGRMVDAQATAYEEAGRNANGAMNGFMGVGMVGGMGNMMGGGQSPLNFVQSQNAQHIIQPQSIQPQPQQAPAASVASWKCLCGVMNEGKFCKDCGGKKQEELNWTCKCGKVNMAKFCNECGSPRISKPKEYKCDKCGWEPEDKTNPPKFCPECGDKIDENDMA